ncbi:hypothetical protein EYM_02030 [Ignicoccus islandicus DSM 13165]|uniref:Uncharacterized protein n=1 Tax=Ignicoccus islandicus DSM 13165 TaxID=940295 RepID=A0A0U3EAS0_9CREN|nr:hypothetical protein [Ignicoccus islandicus]ALU11523.1 hypothetical protein EYM_02030 [Ignicoccus islandicus DSM 13165]
MNVAEARAREFLEKYGERGEMVVRAALEVADAYRRKGKAALGDFDFKGVVKRLKQYGVDYNPSPLLSKLEKEYALIETSYKSSNQHWWKFVDEEALRLALNEEEEDEEELDPQIAVLKVQVAALELDEAKEKLAKIINRKKMTVADKKWFKNFAFETLPLIAKVAEKVLEEGIEDPELLEAVEVIKLALKASKLAKVKVSKSLDLPLISVEE